MAHRDATKSHEASVWKVTRRGLDGITIQFVYEIEGPKHTTFVTHEIKINYCSMRFLGVEFHKIMDELSEDWHKVKSEISGNG
jgi:hypothetical protein